MLVLVGGQKGGTGKSTVATNLVVMRTLQGRDAFLFDIDEQRTSTLWASRRDENEVTPRIPSSQKILDNRVLNAGIVIRNELKALMQKYEDIVVDAGGANNEVLRAAMTLADIAIFPLMPSAFDNWTLATLNDLVAEARQTNSKLIAKVHYNKVAQQPQAAKSEIDESDEVLGDFQFLSKIRVPMIFRASIRRAQNQGLSIVEYKPADEKASFEITALCKEVFNER